MRMRLSTAVRAAAWPPPLRGYRTRAQGEGSGVLKSSLHEAADESFSDALKRLEVTFFNCVVDSALRFETLSQVKDRFGVLLDFSKVQQQMLKDDLKKTSHRRAEDTDCKGNG